MKPARQILFLFPLMAGVLAFGTLGFRWVEGWEWFDSFFMALITLSTVGYQEIHPLSQQGRLFASILILTGVTMILVSIGVLGDFVVKLELADYFGRRRSRRMVGKLSGHYIICGLGRVGRGTAQELRRSGALLVAIDNSTRNAQWAIDQDIPTIVGDATQDETLREAKIGEAAGLVSAIASDAENVYVALSARGLNPNLLISARASSEQAEEKLRRAGANTVFTPYSFIGHRLAQAMLRPHVTSFLDVASAFKRSTDLELEFEQLKVSASSVVSSKTLEESGIKEKHGVIVMAIMKPGEEMQFNPSGKSVIEPDDVLIVMGEREKLKQLELELES